MIIPFTQVIIILVFVSFTFQQITECQTYVSNLIDDISQFNVTSIPLPTLMYSGIVPNNPGQLTECTDSNYSYFLVFIKNTTLMSQSYYGLCLPNQCTADDIEIGLNFLHCRVIDMDNMKNTDNVSKVGGIIVILWVVFIVICSVYIFTRRIRTNEYLTSSQKSENNSDNDHQTSETFSEIKQNETHMLSYFQGYKKIFVNQGQTSILSPILFFAVFSFALSTSYSYKQNISQNQSEIQVKLNSIAGVFVCNVQIALNTIIFIFGYRFAEEFYKIKSIIKIGRYFLEYITKKWLNLILMSMLVYSFCTFFIDRPLSYIWSSNNGKDCSNYIWQIWFLFRNLQLDSKICLPWFSLIQVDLLFSILSLPLIIIFRANKKLGYFLIFILLPISMVISYQILKNESINFQPTKLMNGQKQYWIDYQGNAFVRMGAFSIGLLFGLFICEALDKKKQQIGFQNKILIMMKKRSLVQIFFALLGLSLMVYFYWSITPHLIKNNEEKQETYIYQILAPLSFLISFALFLLAGLCEGESISTKIIRFLLKKQFWTHLDKISTSIYLLSPMIIGYSTYSSSNSIKYSNQTIILYFIGDCFLIYFASILVTSLFQNQLTPIAAKLKLFILGRQAQYNDILIQYL